MSDTPQATPENNPTPTPPATSQGKQQTEGDNGVPQDTVNKLVGSARLEGKEVGKKEALSELLEALGIDDLEKGKSLLKDAKERQEAEMSATEKLQAQLEKLQNQLAEKDAQIEQEKQDRLRDKRDSGLLQQLGSAHDPKKVLTLLKAEKSEDVLALVNEAGEFDSEKANALVNTYMADNAYLFKSTAKGSPSNSNGRVPNPSGKEARKTARRNNARIIEG